MKVKLGDYIKEYSVKNKQDKDIPVYSVTNTLGFCRDYFGKEVASKDKTTYKIVPKGYFAYNPSRINVGSVDWQRNEEEVIISPLYNVFSVSPELKQQYLYYYLKSDITLHFIKEIASGSVRDNLKLSMLYKFPIKVPSIEEQEKIISRLDGIKRIISLREKEIKTLDELIKGRFVELFGECNSYEKLENADVIISDGNYSSKYPTADEFVGDGVPFIRASNMINNTITDEEMYFISKEKHAELLKGHVKPYDVLIATRGAGIGKIAVVPERHNDSNINAQIVLLRCNFKEYNPLYLSWYLKLQTTQMKIQGLVSGSAQPQLPIKRLIQLELLKPEIEMQNQFADFVRQVDKSKVAVQKALDEAQLLFDSLMQKYFG